MIRPLSSSSERRRPGETLYYLASGAPVAIAAYSALDQINMADVRLRFAQRAAKQIDQARYTFSDKLVEQMRREAKVKAQQAVVNLLRGILCLRAGFIC